MRRAFANILITILFLGSSLVSPSLALMGQQDTTKFSIKLYKELAKNKKDKNLLVSPFSISSALGMTINGAAGKTKRDMSSVLGFDNTNLLPANHAYKRTMQSLSNLKSTRLEIANGLFGRKEIKFKSKFLELNKNYYNAGLKLLNFSDPSALGLINNWVSEKTRGKIPKIINNLSDDDVLVLINAIYFKGTWKYAFNKSNTRSQSFFTTRDKEKSVKMMHLSRKFPYFETENFQSVTLPYKDTRLSLKLFLPKKNSDLSMFESGITEEQWKKWKNRFSYRKGHVGLPRFKIKDKMGLKVPLSNLGMADAFNPNKANLTGIAKTKGNLYISKVKHKTFMEVNEKGTEAAAATAVKVALKGGAPVRQSPFTMILNRPFFFALYDRSTDTILFMGHIVDPK